MQALGRKKGENLFNDSYKTAKTRCFCQENTKARESFPLRDLLKDCPCPALSKASCNPSLQGCATAADNMLNHSFRFTEDFYPRKLSSITIPGKMARYLLTVFGLTHKLLNTQPLK